MGTPAMFSLTLLGALPGLTDRHTGCREKRAFQMHLLVSGASSH